MRIINKVINIQDYKKEKDKTIQLEKVNILSNDIRTSNDEEFFKQLRKEKRKEKGIEWD